MINKNITHINFAKGFRGGEKQTYNLILEFSKNDYIQELIVRKNSALSKQCKDIKNLKIIELAKPYFFFVSSIKTSSLIYAHEAKAYQFSYIANLIYKIPYIIIRRVDISIKSNFLNKNIYQKSSKVVVLSTAIKNRVLNLSSKLNCTIIPDSISSFAVDKSNVHTLKEQYKGKFIIGNIAALEKQKGQQYIIEVARKIQNKYPDIHFMLLGKGKDEELFQDLSSDLENITFTGFVSNVGDYLSIFDMFVFPTLSEGFGSSILDAMQFDIPVVASKVGGISDIINDNNGILINLEKEDSLYNAIVELYNNRNLQISLSTRAKETLGNYKIDNIFKQYELLLEKE